jgi:hypothetical protein
VQRPSSSPPAVAPAVDAPPQALNYFLMEYVDGPNLRQVEQAGKLSPREALQIIPQICVALQFAHDEGIVHRDIKPENVLLDKKGRVKIADFGLAKILGQEQQDLRLTGLKDVMGTPHYMAPEQVETPQEVDHRADIYSLGVVFYEMLTGELPLGKFQPPSNKVSIDVRLDDVVLRALAKEPERRYQQASALRTEVETIAGTPGAVSAGTGAVAATPGGASLSSSRLSRLAIVGACWAALFFVIGLLWVFPAQAGSSGFRPTSRLLGLLSVLSLLAVPFLFLGWTAPFGTTILGWIAVAQIRRGAGKLYGLGLAVFDGLVFPLLLLDAVIGAVLLFVTGLLWKSGLPFGISTRGAALVILTPVFLALIAVADFLVVHLTWRAVKRSMGTALPSTQSTGPSKRLALVIGAGLAIPIVIIVVGLIWSNTRRSVQYSYDWQPASLDGSVEALTGAATLRVTDVSREGQVVVLTILSEPGFAPQELVVSFPGPALDSPFAATQVTNVDCLIAPTRNGFGQAAFGQVLAGTNLLRGPGQFRVGFVFADEAVASRAQLQADQVHLGKPRGLDWNQTLCLFALNRRSGTDSRGRPVIELLNGEIALHQAPAVAAGQKPVDIEAEIPAPLVSGTNGLQFRWVARDFETNSPADELPYVDSSSPRPKLRVLKKVVLDDSAVLGAALNQPAGSDSREIVVTLTDSGFARFGELSATNISRQLAIVWDGRVLSAPVILTPIRTPNISINGNFSDRDCDRLLYALNHRNPVEGQIDELKRQLTNAPAASTNELAGNLNARLDAARAILAFPERDKALAGLAHDAARLGDAATAKRALSQITGFNSRDAAARDAVRVLAKDGHRAEALEIARTITSFVERDAALQELAQ